MSTVITDEAAKRNISRNIQVLLERRKISILKFSQDIGEPQNTVYRIVRGDNMPGVALLARMAEFLMVTVDDLLSDPKNFRKVS